MADSEKIVSEDELNALLAKANVLSEALPFIREFRGETVVIKYGGAAMVDAELKRLVVEDIILLHLKIPSYASRIIYSA